MSDDIVTVRGRLGWSNPQRSPSNLALYGPGGRWDGPAGDCIDALLERSGAYEGAHVIVVCFPSRWDSEAADALQQRIEDWIKEARRG